jgi:hypothetical protein
MDTARQVIRWSIPGWIFLFMLALLQILTWLFEGRSAAVVVQVLGPLLTPGAVAMVVTAGIPLGFILYQIYYSWYGTVLPFGFVNRDRGADILQALPTARRDALCSVNEEAPDLHEMAERFEIFLFPHPLRRLRAEFRDSNGRKRFEAKVRDNWDLIRFWLQRIYVIDEAELLRTEIITLSDIYHGVGAARAALFLSCGAHLLLNIFVITHAALPAWHLFAAVVFPYALAFWLFRVFERTRTSALSSLVSMLTLALKTFSVAPSTDADEKAPKSAVDATSTVA